MAKLQILCLILNLSYSHCEVLPNLVAATCHHSRYHLILIVYVLMDTHH